MRMSNLTNEELCLLAKSGNHQAMDTLIENNIGFVKLLAKEAFSKFGILSGVDFDDLIQGGMVALWRCIDKFDESSNTAFLAYSKSAIKNAMTDMVRKHLSSTRSEITSPDGLMDTAGHQLLSAVWDGCCSKSPEQIIIKAETIREMYSALNRLTERERTYLLYRFGFTDGAEHSPSDMASLFSLSISRAKAIEAAALQKMRKLMLL